MAQARLSADAPCWITAERQTQGKGSRGRSWAGIDGNLFASLLLYEPCPPEKMHELTFVAAIAVEHALVSVGLGEDVISLKWPNDVLINGKKISGILLEGQAGDARTKQHVVIGIGINCTGYPDETMHKATSLRDEGIEVTAGLLFQHLTHSMEEALNVWRKGECFDIIRERWLDHAAGLNQQIELHIPGRDRIRGRFVSIDDKGYMLFENPDGVIERVSTADIFFPDQQI